MPPSLQDFAMSLSPPKDLSRFGERTRLVHAGRDPGQQHGFVNTPIYRGSTVLYPTADDFMHRRAHYTYGTKGTPTTEALESAWPSPAPPGRCLRRQGLPRSRSP
jgi:cystathionine beta-lyase